MNRQGTTHRISLQLAALALLTAAPLATLAQDKVNVTLSDPARPALVRVALVQGGITVKGADVKELVVEAHVRGESEGQSSRRAGGMRRLSIASTGLTVEEENNTVRIGTDSHARTVDITVTVPRRTSLKLNATNDGDIVVDGVEGELDINNTNGEVTLTNVSGSVVAHALNGEIKVTFQRIAAKAMAFSSLNGDIDVTFPADLKATISLRTDNGDVYSDFDVQLQAGTAQQIVEDARGRGGKYKVKVDKTIRGTINGGGPELQFTNFNGNIYIRKAGAQ
jgi:DUF4097 and DUF4098 domain-containing protein YvlB